MQWSPISADPRQLPGWLAAPRQASKPAGAGTARLGRVTLDPAALENLSGVVNRWNPLRFVELKLKRAGGLETSTSPLTTTIKTSCSKPPNSTPESEHFISSPLCAWLSASSLLRLRFLSRTDSAARHTSPGVGLSLESTLYFPTLLSSPHPTLKKPVCQSFIIRLRIFLDIFFSERIRAIERPFPGSHHIPSPLRHRSVVCTLSCGGPAQSALDRKTNRCFSL